ncbi:MAG: DHHA1 domain-containing protein, partial [Erysipelotrichaceae bacterium]|nr:DHHA1 domain-containing protein [Erysipelotrichaceae bacterium]
AIAVDCGNLERIDDQRIKLAKKILKIDHHPNVEPFGDDNLVDTSCASCTQLLASIFRAIDENSVSKTCSAYLYRGLLTDSLCYKTSSTSAKTLEIGAYLANKGIDIRAINLELFDIDLKTFKLKTIVRNKIQIHNEHIAYCIFDLDDLNKYELSGKQAREFVNEMGSVKEFAIWAIFNQRQDDKGNILYDGSLRSKHVPINQIAAKYHGGGHANASGIKGLTQNDLTNLLQDLEDILIEQNV